MSQNNFVSIESTALAFSIPGAQLTLNQVGLDLRGISIIMYSLLYTTVSYVRDAKKQTFCFPLQGIVWFLDYNWIA